MSGITTVDLQFEQAPNVQPVHILDVASVSTSAQQGPVTPSSNNATHTTAATDYSFAWTAATVNHVMLQNNTGVSINFDVDQTATAGSPVLATGQTIFLDVVMAALHLWTAAQQNVNGTAAGNIVIRGWQ